MRAFFEHCAIVSVISLCVAGFAIGFVGAVMRIDNMGHENCSTHVNIDYEAMTISFKMRDGRTIAAHCDSIGGTPYLAKDVRLVGQ